MSHQAKTYRDYRWRHRLIFFLRNLPIPGIKRLSVALPKWILPSKSKVAPHFLQTIRGPLVWIDPANDAGVEESLYTTGTYESGTLDFMKSQLNEGSVFIDVGGNIGWHTLNAAQFVGASGQVWTFEPSPKLHETLELNIAENKLNNVRSFQCGIGAQPDSVSLYLNDAINKGASSAVVKSPEAQTVEIQVLPLDQIVDQQKIRVDLIKVDVEGMEKEVLIGAQHTIADQLPALIVECSASRTEAPNARQELIEYLLTLDGYQWFKSRNGKERSNGLVEVVNFDDFPVDDNVYGRPKK